MSAGGFSISLDTKATRRDLARLSGRNMEKAIASALNRTIKSVAAEGNRQIREELNLQTPALRKRLKVGKARTGDLTARFTVFAKPSPLTDFRGTRQTARGVSVKIKTKGARKTIRGAFLVRFKSGRFTAVTRRTIGGKRVGRLPVDQLFSTSAVGALGKPRVLVALEAHARKRYAIELAHEIKRLLPKGT